MEQPVDVVKENAKKQKKKIRFIIIPIVVFVIALLLTFSLWYIAQQSGTKELLPLIVLISGISLSFLVCVTLYLLLNSRSDAVLLAKDMTRALKTQTLVLEEEKNKVERERVRDEAILGSLGEGIIVTGKDGNVVLINKSAEYMLDWKMDEVIGKAISEIFPLEDEKEKSIMSSELPITQVLTSGQKTLGLYFYRGKSSTKLPIALTVSPVFLKESIIGAVGLFRDITEERKLDQAKSEFVALASHQLRTPISAISWFTEMLLHGDAGPITQEQKDHLTQIYQSNRRMADLVDAMLNVSRIETDSFAIHPEPTNIAEISHRILTKEISQRESTKVLHIKEQYDQTIQNIPLDQDIIKIIFQNLFSNAIKYTPDNGTILVEILLSRQSGPASDNNREGILIKVTDTGYGIPRSQEKKIFTKLFRADNVKEKDPDGTGLGLFIIKSVLDTIDGNIWFTSVEKEGTIFFVWLPKEGMPERSGTKTLVPTNGYK